MTHSSRAVFAARIVSACMWLAMVLSPGLAAADSVILRVTGADATSGERRTIAYTLENLRNLPRSDLKTRTNWTSGIQEFEGVLLLDLWRMSGLAMPSAIRASALNDYDADIPISDIEGDTVLVADRVNARDMRVRDKGPLWIIYPEDSDSIDYLEKMVWQLSDLEAID